MYIDDTQGLVTRRAVPTLGEHAFANHPLERPLELFGYPEYLDVLFEAHFHGISLDGLVAILSNLEVLE
jgi:hypothetical protein